MNGMQQSAVTFSIAEQLFAVDIDLVQEFLWLPSLTPLEEQPAYVRGAFDLRGELVKVIDLNLRFGHPTASLHGSQVVVVTRSAQGLIGIIADELVDFGIIHVIAGKATSVSGGQYRPLVLAQFEYEGRMGTLLSPDELVAGDTFPFEHLIDRADPFATFTERELQQLSRRQQEYKKVEQADSVEQTRSIAIAALSGELLGFPVDMIREFAYLHQLYPLPGTPPFVLGNINLRGEIVTVFDIAQLLGVSAARIQTASRLVVYEYQYQLIGFVVDDLLDITNISRESISDVPVAVPAARRALLAGECRFDNRPVAIVDAATIFTSGKLVVDQE